MEIFTELVRWGCVILLLSFVLTTVILFIYNFISNRQNPKPAKSYSYKKLSKHPINRILYLVDSGIPEDYIINECGIEALHNAKMTHARLFIEANNIRCREIYRLPTGILWELKNYCNSSWFLESNYLKKEDKEIERIPINFSAIPFASDERIEIDAENLDFKSENNYEYRVNTEELFSIEDHMTNFECWINLTARDLQLNPTRINMLGGNRTLSLLQPNHFLTDADGNIVGLNHQTIYYD